MPCYARYGRCWPGTDRPSKNEFQQKLIMRKRFKPKLLVVDDEPQMLRFLCEVLTRLGAQPQGFSSSRAAAEIVNLQKFDGVFLDWIMPEMDGLALAERIRWSKSNSLCPIVMVTAYAEPDGIRRCFQARINCFLQKPVTAEQVRQLFKATYDLMLQERLRYQRVPAQVPAVCAWQVQSFEQKAKGQSVNLSTTGMLAKLDATPVPGSLAKLKFTLPTDTQPCLLKAFVVRLAPDQQVGLRFVNLTREERWRLAGFSKSMSKIG